MGTISCLLIPGGGLPVLRDPISCMISEGRVEITDLRDCLGRRSLLPSSFIG
ncbi:hypothetical protein ASZ90_010827 [hydrocarbon metagenome]|uniref:Uncharacterized protein n=1 Tax=hydrocarbon metagenome TaxID=938273 RepID=A0A0W8FF91_9ZZZZ